MSPSKQKKIVNLISIAVISFLLIFIFCIFIGDTKTEVKTLTVHQEYHYFNKKYNIIFRTESGETIRSRDGCFSDKKYSQGSTHEVIKNKVFINDVQIYTYYSCS